MAGVIGKSTAMIADGVHSLSDFLTDIVVLIGFKFTSKPEDDCHNYGHGKYETLATMIISFILAVAGYQILKVGMINIIKVINGEIIQRPSIIALVVAIISIITKESLYRYTLKVGKRIDSSSITANAWHHRTDAFSSIGTMIGIAGAIVLGEKWAILDPIAAIIVSLFIFKVAYEVLIPSLNELVEKSLSNDERLKVESILKDCPDIMAFHQLRMRKVGPKIVIECHILVDKALNIKEAHDISTEVEMKITSLFKGPLIVTIHIEPFLE